MFNLPISAKEVADLYDFARRAADAGERQADALERIATALETQNAGQAASPVG